MDPTAGTGIASASPVCVRQHMIRMLPRLQRRSVAHLPCRAVAEVGSHLTLGNESQTLDGLARKTGIAEVTFISWKLRRHA
jgi:hypothetical protein